MKTNFLTSTKVSKSNNGKGKTFTYSTVIPKVMVTKFGLDKGTKLHWDIKDDQILITPELPETKSIEAGMEILNDIFLNQNDTYSQVYKSIFDILNNNGLDKETKIKQLKIHKLRYTNTFKNIVTYLLDYPLNIPDQYEILTAVYDKITETD